MMALEQLFLGSRSNPGIAMGNSADLKGWYILKLLRPPADTMSMSCLPFESPRKPHTGPCKTCRILQNHRFEAQKYPLNFAFGTICLGFMSDSLLSCFVSLHVQRGTVSTFEWRSRCHVLLSCLPPSAFWLVHQMMVMKSKANKHRQTIKTKLDLLLLKLTNQPDQPTSTHGLWNPT